MSSVYFRSLEPSDAELIYKWQNDQEMMKNAVGLARPWSMTECRNWIEAKTKHDPYNYWFAICLNDGSGKMIGYTGVNSIHYINSSATCNAIVIGEKEYRDGITWIDTYLLIFDFVFNKLHLNRYYGQHSETQKITDFAEQLFFFTKEGVGREAIYLNGKYIDIYYKSLLRREYLEHLEKGDYELMAIIKRFKKLNKNK